MTIRYNVALGASSSTIALLALLTALPAFAQSESKTDQVQEIVVTARKSSENVQKVPVAVTALTPEVLAAHSMTNLSDIASLTPSLVVKPSQVDGTGLSFTLRGMSGTGLYGESAVGIYVDGVLRQTQNGLNTALVDLERVEVLKGPQGTLYGKNTTGGVINLISNRPKLDEFSGYVTARVGAYASSGVSGAYDEWVEGAINFPLVQDRLALRLTAANHDANGYGRDGNGRRLNNHDDPYVHAQLLFEPNNNWQFLLSGDYMAANSNGVLSPLVEANPGNLAIATGVAAGLINPRDIPSAKNGFKAGPTFAGGEAAAVGILRKDVTRSDFYSENATNDRFARFRGGGTSLTVDGDVTDRVHLKSISAYRHFADQNELDEGGSKYGQFSPTFADNANFFSQEIDLSGKLDDAKLEWLTGAFYSYFDNKHGDVPGVGSQEFPALAPVSYQFKTDAATKSLGFFGHGVYHPTSRLSFTAGVRWSEDWRSAIAGDRILSLDATRILSCIATGVPPGATVANGCTSPKLSASFSGISYEGAANYQVTSDIMAYVTTRHGFRSGDINSLGSYYVYQPEFATDYEVGLKSTWFDRRLLFDVAAYYTDYTNIQRATTVPNGAGGVVTRVENAASAVIKGVEVNFVARPLAALEFDANYSYTDAHYIKFLAANPTNPSVLIDQSRLEFDSPPHAVNVSGTYTARLRSGDAVIASVSVSWQDKQYFGGNSYVYPNEQILRQLPYFLVDSRLTYKLMRDDMSISVFVRNLTGTHYYTSAQNLLSAAGVAAMTPGAPRFVGVEFTKRFGP